MKTKAQEFLEKNHFKGRREFLEEIMQSYADQCVKAREEEIREWMENYFELFKIENIYQEYCSVKELQQFLSTPSSQVEPTQAKQSRKEFIKQIQGNTLSDISMESAYDLSKNKNDDKK